MSIFLLLATLAAAPMAPVAPAPQQAAAAVSDVCPAPVRLAPRYPAKQLIGNVGGTAVVLANIDECGRVLSPRIVTSSGHAELDQEALFTVSAWVLSPAQRALAKDGVLKLPVKFGGLQSSTVQMATLRLPWPKSHRRPYFRVDENSIGFDSIEDFLGDKTVQAVGFFKQPYAEVHDGRGGRVWTTMLPDRNHQDVFWLTYSLGDYPPRMPAGAPRRANRTLGLARYRLVEEDGKPVVRLGLLCDAGPEECAQLSEFLLKGLPFARPPRR